MTEETNKRSDSELSEEVPLLFYSRNETDEVKIRFCFREKIECVLRNMTVEPTVGLFMLGFIISSLTTQNLSLEKACRVNLNFSAEICHSLKLQELGNQNVYELQTQKLLTQFLSYRTYITATIPSIIAILAGSFSDITGYRKFFLIIPIAGQIIGSTTNMLNVYFFHKLSLEVLILSEAFIEGITGSVCLLGVTSFAFISTITTNKERTFRIGLLNFAFTLAFPMGMGISGVLLKNLGYYACYGLTASLHLINLCYNAFFLQEPKRSIEQKLHDNNGVLNLCRIFFDFANIKLTIQEVFKNGSHHRRRRMILILLVVSILFGPLYGEISVLYLNTRYRFNWDEVKFSIYQSYNSVIHTIGTIFSITVFSRYLQWHDSILGIVSILSKIASSFIYCFAPTGQIFYIASFVDIFNGTAFIALRSIVSKLVVSDELGKVNSIFGMTETLIPLVYIPLYASVYNATMEDLPGAVFLMGTALCIPAIVVFTWLWYEQKKQAERSQQYKQNAIRTLLNIN